MQSSLKPFAFRRAEMTLKDWHQFVAIDTHKFYPAGPARHWEIDVANDIRLIHLGGRNAKSLNEPDSIPNVCCLVWQGEIIRFCYHDEFGTIGTTEKWSITVLDCVCPLTLHHLSSEIREAYRLATLSYIQSGRPPGYFVTCTDLTIKPYEIRFV